MSAARWSTGGCAPQLQCPGRAVTRDAAESVTRDATSLKEPHGTPTMDMDNLPDASARSPGAPERGDHVMTAAQRQRAYRWRCKRAATEAIGEEARASRVTLLAMLSRDLAMLDDKRAKRMHPALQSSAQRVLRVIVTRYGIDLADQS